MQYQHFTVKGQLSCAFGLLASLALAVSLVALQAVSGANANLVRYEHVVVAQDQLVNQVADAVNRRAIAARNLVLVNTPEDMALEKQAVLSAHKDTQDALAKLNTAVEGDAQGGGRPRALVGAINRIEAQYGPVALDIVQLALNGDKDAAVLKMNKECRPLLAALLGAAHEYQAFSIKAGEAATGSAEADFVQARTLLLAVSGVAIAAAMALGFLITRSLMRSLGGEPGTAAALAGSVAQGDLSMPITLRPGDRTSLMAQLKTMQESLAGVVANVRQNAEGVSHASREIAQGNNDLSARTEQQASALEQTAASMEQLSSTVVQNADNARHASELATAASAVAGQGGDVVGQVVTTMKGINESSRKIADIISVIDGIAFQTNILALNAAVEAARAGEQGRGFAVVASEVRSLAQRSADAAKQIKTLIDTSVDQVDQGTRLVAQAGDTMREVVSSIQRVTDIIGAVSAASSEQSAGVSQVGQAITQMDQVTQQNAAVVEESAGAADSLRVQAEQMLEAVAVFRLGAAHEADGSTPQADARPRPALANRQPASRLINASRALPAIARPTHALRATHAMGARNGTHVTGVTGVTGVAQATRSTLAKPAPARLAFTTGVTRQ